MPEGWADLLAEKLVPKSSHRKKEKPLRKKRRLPAGVRLSQPSRRKGGLKTKEEPLPFTSDVNTAEERKKPHLIALSFCDFISFDQTGKINLLGCFDRIYRNKEEKSTGAFYLYVRTAGIREGQIAVTFFDAKDEPVAQVGYLIEPDQIQPDQPSHVQFYGRIGFEVEELGDYWVDVAWDNKSVGGRHLTISEREEEKGENEQHANTE